MSGTCLFVGASRLTSLRLFARHCIAAVARSFHDTRGEECFPLHPIGVGYPGLVLTLIPADQIVLIGKWSGTGKKFGTKPFDLASDPEELHDLVADPAHAEVRDTLMGALSERWNREEIQRHVTESRRRRNLVYRAHAEGIAPVWDYAMDNDPVRRYQRNYREPWQTTEARALLR